VSSSCFFTSSAEVFGKLWDQLTSNDFTQGAEAAETLTDAPDQAIAYVVERLDAVKPPAATGPQPIFFAPGRTAA
jgi:hypothetical protein